MNRFYLMIVLACTTAALAVANGHARPGHDDAPAVAPKQAGQEQVQPKPEQPLVLTIKTRKKEYDQLEPIVVHFELRNVSNDKRFIFDRSYPTPRDFSLSVQRDGVEVPLTAFDADQKGPNGYHKGSMKIVRPGDSGKGSIIVNLLHDMSVKGGYTIVLKAAMRSSGFKPTPDDVHVQSEPIKVVVKGGPDIDYEDIKFL